MNLQVNIWKVIHFHARIIQINLFLQKSAFESLGIVLHDKCYSEL